MELDKKTLAKKIMDNLSLAAKIRKDYVNNKELNEVKNVLKTFQVERLKFTHQECLENPETKEATNFFLSEIYNDKDLTSRDRDLEKVVPMMCKLFPADLLVVLSDAIELDALTEVLDMHMCKNLSPDFTGDEYKAVYQTTSFEDRKRQIELTNRLGHSLMDVVKFPLIGGLLKKMSLPAKMMGLQDMHNLLLNGFMIFKNTKDVPTFLKTLIDKEYEVLNEIFDKQTVN